MTQPPAPAPAPSPPLPVVLAPPAPVLSVSPLTERALDSMIALPISASLAQLRKRVDAQIPAQLLDKRGSQRVSTPVGKSKIKYRVRAWRDGPLQLSSRAGALFIDLPIAFKVNATRSGLIDVSKTLHGALVVHGRLDLDIAPTWDLTPQVTLSFSWQKKPCFSLFFGLWTICVHNEVKPEIARVLEQTSGELTDMLQARLPVRSMVHRAWTLAHQSVQVADQPPVHVAARPQALHVASLQLDGQNLRLDVGMRVQLRTTVGAQPVLGQVAPLPPPIRTRLPEGLRFFVPVSVEYASIARTLEDHIGNLPIPLPRLWSAMTIDRVALTADREDLIFQLSLKVAGRHRAYGHIYLRGHMDYRPADKQLRITDMQFDPATRSYLQDQAPWLLDSGLTTALRDPLVIDMKERLEREQQSLNERLNVESKHIRTRGALETLTFDKLQLGRDRALLFVQARGQLQVQIQP